MDQPQLSLSPSLSVATNIATKRLSPSPPPTKNESNSRKRKQSYVELLANDPLPSDWEQCLDLKSGRMYYLNRRSSTKMWNRPCKEQKLNLELSIMPALSDETAEKGGDSDHGGMAAVVCLNCHLLVMLHRSSPLCPNCRHMHSLPGTEPRRALETLDLLN